MVTAVVIFLGSQVRRTSLSPMLSERGNVSNTFFVSKYVLEKGYMSTIIYNIV